MMKHSLFILTCLTFSTLPKMGQANELPATFKVVKIKQNDLNPMMGRPTERQLQMSKFEQLMATCAQQLHAQAILQAYHSCKQAQQVSNHLPLARPRQRYFQAYALNNYAIASYKAGKHQQANELFNLAIERLDNHTLRENRLRFKLKMSDVYLANRN